MITAAVDQTIPSSANALSPIRLWHTRFPFLHLLLTPLQEVVLPYKLRDTTSIGQFGVSFLR